MSVEIDHLTKQYGQLTVIEDLSLRFASGKVSVLLGPSGCGKTTTLRCIAGLEDPVAGRIAIEGRTVFDADGGINLPPEAREIGMVFQSYAIWPHMSVFENVALPLKARGIPRNDIESRVLRTLAIVGLGEMAGRSATKLSGGQQQRVALARCIASHPKLILLDEPLSNLDAKLRVEMRAELKELQRSLHATMLFVTHDQDEALSLADEIFLFDRGRVVQSGTPRELYFHPRSRFAAEFLGKANLFPVRVTHRAEGVEVRSRNADVAVAVLPSREQASGDCWAMIRPESWRLSPPGPGIPATIEDTTFIGDRQMIRASTPLGTQLVSATGFARIDIGDQLCLAVDAERVQLIDIRDAGPDAASDQHPPKRHHA